MRENSGQGLDAYKSLSVDGGESWQGPFPFPLPGCDRPVAGMVDDDLMLITHRYMQGGKGWIGWWTQVGDEVGGAVGGNSLHYRVRSG